jgi:hypothetical protein
MRTVRRQCTVARSMTPLAVAPCAASSDIAGRNRPDDRAFSPGRVPARRRPPQRRQPHRAAGPAAPISTAAGGPPGSTPDRAGWRPDMPMCGRPGSYGRDRRPGGGEQLHDNHIPTPASSRPRLDRLVRVLAGTITRSHRADGLLPGATNGLAMPPRSAQRSLDATRR